MPEGPEIRRAADRIETVLKDEEAVEVRFAFAHLQAHQPELEGRVVTRVETRGKAMLTWFDDALAVYSHNQLYGRWYIRRKDGLPAIRRQLRFSVRTNRGAALLYSASEIVVLRSSEVEAHPFLAKLGPDPLHAGVTPTTIRRQLQDARFRRRNLAALYLDQSFVAGIGNYLRSEILFAAGVHPQRRPIDLDVDEQRRLSRATLTITRRSYRTGGITNEPALAKALKSRGERRRSYRHFVFGRGRAACRVCDEAVRQVELAGRRLYLCPGCQPPVAADSAA